MVLLPLMIWLELTIPLSGTNDDPSPLQARSAGAVFTPETPVVLASAMESLWINIPFPNASLFDETELETAMKSYEEGVRHLWRNWTDKDVCNNANLTGSLINVTTESIRGLKYEVQEIRLTLERMRTWAASYINGSAGAVDRNRRWIEEFLMGASAAIVLAPELKKGFAITCLSLGSVGAMLTWSE